MRAKKRIYLSVFFGICTLAGILYATVPEWWTERGVTNNQPQVDQAPVLQGQAKHIVYQAYLELEDRLAPVGGAGAEVTALIQSAWFTDSMHDNRPLLLGQLKHLARPFYDRLNAVGFTTDDVVTGDTSFYPWTANSGDDADDAPATLGQLKFAFSFNPAPWAETDEDGDTLPDLWEQQIVDADPNDAIAAIEDVLASDDFDGDGLINGDEFIADTNPLKADALQDHDSDRYPTFYEVLNGSDPSDAASIPEATYIVDVNAEEGGDGSVEFPFNTIEAAVGAVTNPYDIVLVKPGTYPRFSIGPINPFLLISEQGALNTIVDAQHAGQALSISNSSVINGFTFTKGILSGSGILIAPHQSPQIQNCIISNNVDTENSNASGAIYCHIISAPVFSNCLIQGNRMGNGGGVFAHLHSRPSFIHCTFLDNSAVSLGNSIHTLSPHITILNSIIWNTNSGSGEISGNTSGVDISHSVVRGGWFRGDNVYDTNPLLSPEGYLSASSPAIDAGEHAGILYDFQTEIRPAGLLSDIGFDEFTDSDGDNLSDAWERLQAGNLNVLSGFEGDNDNDALSNEDEFLIGSNPFDSDSDNDGLSDGSEVNVYSTDPLNPDTDNDGIIDGLEVANNLNPLIDDALNDVDGDRYPNIFEVLKGSNPQDAQSLPLADAVIDPDNGNYPTIQSGIDMVSDDYDIVLVKAGTYSERLSVSSTPFFLLIGEQGAFNTIVDARGIGRALNLSSKVVISGLTFTGGVENGGGIFVGALDKTSHIQSCIIQDNNSDESFGAIFCNTRSSPVFTNCLIRNNRMKLGGGAYVFSSSHPRFIHCTFLNNSAIDANGGDNIYVHNIHGDNQAEVVNSILWNPEGSMSANVNAYIEENIPELDIFTDFLSISHSDLGNYSDDNLISPEGYLSSASWGIIDGGKDAGVSSDFQGEQRPFGSFPDIGFDEFTDNDGDNLSDAWERAKAGNLTVLDGIQGDNDGDGLTNEKEFFIGSNPLNSDSDSDGLSDADEVNTYKTNPINIDTDKDGISDSLEIANNLNPLTDDALDDGDGDRYPNIFEILKGSDPQDRSSYLLPDIVVDPESGSYPTIQSGIDAVSADYEIVLVKPGTYSERLSINSKPLFLLISEQGASTTIVDAQGVGRALYIDDDTIIDGFTLTGGIEDGGGIFVGYNQSPHIQSCIIRDNHDTESSGAVYCDSYSAPIFTNCLILNNEMRLGGGAYIYYDSQPHFLHCTFLGNRAVRDNGGNGIYSGSDSNQITVLNSILWDIFENGSAEINGSVSRVIASNSIIHGGFTSGTDIFDIDPRLSSDGYLTSGSPAIDLATNSTIANDIQAELRPIGSASDLGADEFFDDDNDTLLDVWEQQIIDANPSDAIQTITDVLPEHDFDQDGMSNLLEFEEATNPLLKDSDFDGMEDMFEYYYALEPTDDGTINAAKGPDGNLDNDSRTNLEEFNLGSLPLSSSEQPAITIDSPNIVLAWFGVQDRVYFMQESTNLVDWSYTGDYWTGQNAEIRQVFPIVGGSKFWRLIIEAPPYGSDFDQDGLENYFEIINALDPLDPSDANIVVGHWPLDELSGVIAPDISILDFDADLNGFAGNAPQWVDGAFGTNAVHFDGTGLQHMAIPHQVVEFGKNVTILYWLRTTDLRNHAMLSAANAVNDNEFLIRSTNAGDTIEVFDGEAFDSSVSWTGLNLADGSWHHLAIVRNQTAQNIEAFLDGQSLGSQPALLNSLTIDSEGFLFGQDQDSVGGEFNPEEDFVGDLDDLRIYRRPLTAQEIQDIRNIDQDSGGSDGLPDWWEVFYFGNLSRDSDEDFDNDGLTNLEEFQLDKNPADFSDGVVGNITGFKWNDLNSDGIRDTDEPPLVNATVYLDLDADNQLDAGELTAQTDADGAYAFTGLGPGTYRVAEVIAEGYLQTFPGALNNCDLSTQGLLLNNSQPLPLMSYTGSDQPLYIQGEIPAPLPGQILPQTAQSGSLIRMDAFRNDPLFAGIDGSGYAVVICDTGLDVDHPFFGSDGDNDGISDRIVFQYDFAHNDFNASDFNGHGSNVTSIALSSDAVFTGMAPGASIIHLKIFTDAGGSSFALLEAALQWVASNADFYNIVSVNLSVGDSQNYNVAVTQSFYGVNDELAALAALNVFPVSSSGNSFFPWNSTSGVGYPAADPNSLSIGAVYDASIGRFSYSSGAIAYSTAADRIAPFSQRDVDLTTIFAPGAPITGASASGGTVSFHGTSQAAPHIAGIAALVQQMAEMSLGRRLSQAEFVDLLRSTAVTINDGDDENDNVINTGLDFPRVDMLALAEGLLELAGPAVHEVVVESGDVIQGINFGNRQKSAQ